MRKKKSQMEIMGLAIVVILISLGFLFILKFNILKKPSETQKEFTKTEIASNFLSSLLKTTSIDCYDLSMNELFQDCGKGPTIVCENGKDSCRYVSAVTQEILNKTLDVWRMKYEFKAYINEDTDNNIKVGKFGNCPGEKIVKIYPLSIGSSNVFLKMAMC